MDHELMLGMLVGGVLMSAVPIVLGVAIGVGVLRHLRAARRSGTRPAPPPS